MDNPDVDLIAAVHSPVPGKLRLGQRQSMQQKHLLLTHAYKCQQREKQSRADGQVWQCSLARCKKMKGILNHMMSCPSEKKCICSTSRQLMKRFSHCKKEYCPVCVQRKEWQMNITAEQRTHIVDLLVQASTSDFTRVDPCEQEGLLLSAKVKENDMYKISDTLSEYYRTLAVKKWDLEMDREKKRRSWGREEYHQQMLPQLVAERNGQPQLNDRIEIQIQIND